MVIHPIWEAEPMCIRIPIDKLLAMPSKHMSLGSGNSLSNSPMIFQAVNLHH